MLMLFASGETIKAAHLKKQQKIACSFSVYSANSNKLKVSLVSINDGKILVRFDQEKMIKLARLSEEQEIS